MNLSLITHKKKLYGPFSQKSKGKRHILRQEAEDNTSITLMPGTDSGFTGTPSGFAGPVLGAAKTYNLLWGVPTVKSMVH